MALADRSRGEALLDLVAQREQPHRVGHGGATAAHAFGDLVLCNAKLAAQALVRDRLFDGVQIFTLQVLHERQLQQLAVRRFLHDHGHSRQTSAPGSPQAAFAGDELIDAFRVARTDEERLEHAMLLHALDQPVKSFFVECGAWLMGIGNNEVHVDFVDTTSGGGDEGA